MRFARSGAIVLACLSGLTLAGGRVGGPIVMETLNSVDFNMAATDAVDKGPLPVLIKGNFLGYTCYGVVSLKADGQRKGELRAKVVVPSSAESLSCVPSEQLLASAVPGVPVKLEPVMSVRIQSVSTVRNGSLVMGCLDMAGDLCRRAGVPKGVEILVQPKIAGLQAKR